MKNKGLLRIGYAFFIIEMVVGFFYGMTMVPWERLRFLLSEASLSVILLFIWNLAGAIFLWIGYRTQD